MSNYDERAMERENDAADIRGAISEARAADTVDYIASQPAAFNNELDELCERIKEDDDGLAKLVQFCVARSVHRPYRNRPTVLAYDISQEVMALVNKHLAAHVGVES